MENIWRTPWVVEWTQYLLDSYAYWLKKELIPRQGTSLEQAERLFACPIVVVSHGLQDDPILNYGNQTASNPLGDGLGSTHTNPLSSNGRACES